MHSARRMAVMHVFTQGLANPVRHATGIGKMGMVKDWNNFVHCDSGLLSHNKKAKQTHFNRRACFAPLSCNLRA